MRGFTLVEMVVAMALMLAITSGVFAAIQSSDRALVQSESADMQQRMRVALDAILHDGLGATGVKPCRWGGPSADPAGTFKSDTVTFMAAGATTTYWLKTDSSTETFQLTQWKGGASADVPVVDHVVALRFDYFGDGGAPLAGAALAELPGLRSIVMTLRVEAAVSSLRGPAGPLFARAGTASTPRRWAPDLEMPVHIAPRNLNLER